MPLGYLVYSLCESMSSREDFRGQKMRVSRITASVAALLFLPGLGLATSVQGSVRQLAAPTAVTFTFARGPVMYEGWGTRVVRPRHFYLPDSSLTHLRWSLWSRAVAHAHGTYSEAVGGRLYKESARVTFSNVKIHKGTRYYASMRVGLYKHGRWTGGFRARMRGGYWQLT
jgi:hypothetical protein